ncbi:rab geranylgeranyl transferase escort protein-like protein [Polyplosphaeria fusca]|uniref:Rab proteins geranylgeranyltransferase n=1 Tax=Polyplosphaeria fusca TaxID=682080 RepID=A0A9P4R2K3_9PLEO|nr:rab geranylgeranyl transferase escort protein-like protein [Polyplosphaeria fusca]
MDTLDKTEWDVVLVGTDLKQSLLALALSRSGRKILHIDENRHYGGAEAAFSLQEAEEFAKKVDEDTSAAAFTNVSISTPDTDEPTSSATLLSPSRAYTLALCPQLIYARSALLDALISSKVYRQLEFVAVGSWWVYSVGSRGAGDEETSSSIAQSGKLLKVPNGREDVFQDEDLDFKAKRALMKFLRFIGNFEEQTEQWQPYRTLPFPTFLKEQFKVPPSLHAPLLALTLSPANGAQTTTEYALPRIARYLKSIGALGAGFGSIISKWGGMSDIAQIGCRASAVGGGVYVLEKGIAGEYNAEGVEQSDAEAPSLRLRLKGGESVTTRWVIGSKPSTQTTPSSFCRSISIVASPLQPLFPPIGEEAPPPACAVIVFPSGSLLLDGEPENELELPPVNIMAHTSDTGECPRGQCILYASTSLSGQRGQELVKNAVDTLLHSIGINPIPTILWSMQYEQRADVALQPTSFYNGDRVLGFSPLNPDLAFDDSILDEVKEIWLRIMGGEGGSFLVFEDREANINDDE